MSNEIVFVAGDTPQGGSQGHTSYVRVHATAAIRAGFEPHIFCPARDTGIEATDIGVIHRVRAVPLGSFTGSFDLSLRKCLIPWHAPAIAASVERFLSGKKGSALIHGFSSWSWPAVVSSRRLRRRGTTAVAISSFYTTSAHESLARARGHTPAHGRLAPLRFQLEHLWLKHVLARYERRAYRESRLVLVNYEAVRRQLVVEYGPGPEIRKLPYTSHSAFRHADSREAAEVPEAIRALRPPDAPLVVSVSRHDPRKGLHVLIEALARLRRAGVAFRACLLSGGSLLDAHRRLARRVGLDGVAALVGWVTDPFPYLQQADVYVLPSLQEGSGALALVEALQAGAAVVASGIDGIPEDVQDGDSALLVPPGDAGALAAAIGRLLTGPALRERLAAAARRTFETRFSAEAFVEALRKTYLEILSS